MPKAKNDVQDTSINDPQQNISVKVTYYFNILKQSILDFFWELPNYLILIQNFFLSIHLVKYVGNMIAKTSQLVDKNLLYSLVA